MRFLRWISLLSLGGTLVLAALTGLALALPEDPSSSWPMVYALRDRSGYWSVQRVDVDRRVQLTLVSDQLINVQPSLSPDDRFVLWLNNADGITYLYDRQTDTRQTLRGRVSLLPAWSPESRSLAFVDLDGVLQRAMLDTAGRLGVPQPVAAALPPETRLTGVGPWSPDGTAVLVFYDPGANLAAIDLASGAFTPLTTDPLTDDYSPAWSPDSAWVLYASWTGLLAHLRAVRRDGTDDRIIVENPGLTQIAPVWSPDGRRLLLRTEPSPDRPQLSVALFQENARPRVVTSLLPDNSPAVWSPDGRRAAFRHADDNDLYWTYVPEVAFGVAFPAFRLTDNNGVNVPLR